MESPSAHQYPDLDKPRHNARLYGWYNDHARRPHQQSDLALAHLSADLDFAAVLVLLGCFEMACDGRVDFSVYRLRPFGLNDPTARIDEFWTLKKR